MNERKDSWDEAILLDAGDVFDRGYSVPDAQREELKARAALYMKAYDKLGYAAFTPGDRDVKVLGVDELVKLDKATKFPILCANLTDSKGNAVFKPYVVIERRKHRIGIFGLINAGAEPLEGRDRYLVTDPIEAAKAAVKELLEKEKVQVVVLLGHIEQRDAARLAQEVPGIDVIIGGQGQTRSSFLEQMGDSWYSEAGSRGQTMNGVILHLSDQKRRPFVVRETAEKLQQELRTMDARIAQYVAMAQRPAQAGGQPSAGERYRGVIQSMVAQRQILVDKAKTVKAASPDEPFLGLLNIDIPKTLADDPEIAAWTQAYKTAHPSGGQVHRPAVAVPPPAAIPPSKALQQRAPMSRGERLKRPGQSEKSQ